MESALGLSRNSPFSYTCHQCSRCCFGKQIRLNPYELIRLATVLSCSTSEVIDRYTEAGVALAVRDVPGEPCVFLGEGGCTVHEGRPLACRLYPLGRVLDSDGTESFCEVEPHPRSEGIYGAQPEATVGDYLEAQQVEPFFAAAEDYYRVFQRVRRLLTAVSETEQDDPPGATERSEDAAVHLLDADAQIIALGQRVPANPEERLRLHLRALHAWLDRFEAG